MDVAAFRAAQSPADHRAVYASPIRQVYASFGLDAPGSPSRYRRYESGRGVNYYDADDNLRRTLRAYLPEPVTRWA
jgi:hypothetical protein